MCEWRHDGPCAFRHISFVMHDALHNQCNFIADVPSQLQVRARGAGVGAPHVLDVVCCCKRFLCDSRLSRAPILIVPFERMRACPTPPRSPRPMYRPSDKLALSWLELAELLLDENPGDEGMARAATYLLNLANSDLRPEPMPELLMHENPPWSVNSCSPDLTRHPTPAGNCCPSRRSAALSGGERA